MGHPFSLSVAAFVLAAGLFLFMGWSHTTQADQDIAELQLQLHARDLALSGLNLTAQRLGAFTQSVPTGWVGTEALALAATAYQQGSYATTILPLGDTVQVNAVGTTMGFMRDGAPRTIRHLIQARYVRPTTFVSNDTLPLVNGVPKGFNYAILGNTEVSIHGNVDVEDLSAVTALDTTMNANVHSNGLLETRGNAFLVQGHGSYAGSLNSSHPQNFVPVVAEHETAVYQTAPIQLPQINMATLSATATYLHAGAFSIDGRNFPYTSFADWAAALGAPAGTGTADHPFILMVNGPLEFRNRVALSGYAIIAATDGIAIYAQDLNGGVIGDLVDQRTTVSMFTPGEIRVQGNASVTATLYGDQGVSLRGGPSVVGGVVSGQAYASSGGNPSIAFALPDPAVILRVYGTLETHGLALVDYGDWPLP